MDALKRGSLNTWSVVFSGGSGFPSVERNTTLTLAPALVVRGKTGALGQSGIRQRRDRQLINQGLVAADVAGGTLTIAPTQFENPDTIRADGAGTTVVVRVNPFTNTGTIEELNGGKVRINP